jgi:hypothetical protein
LIAVLALAIGCAETHYVPEVVARGELTLQYRHSHYEMWAGGQRVARGLGWDRLPGYVGCVAQARQHAEAARAAGRHSVGLSVAGGLLGGIALGGLTAFWDTDHAAGWLAGGVATATLGVALAGAGRLMRNRANGHAVDALNFYNDAVGALGATCADLTYPPPIAPVAPSLPAPPEPAAPPAFAAPPAPAEPVAPQ